MAKKEVIDLMGKPSKTEAYEIQGKRLEFWLYLTEYEWKPEYTPLETRLAFKKGLQRGGYIVRGVSISCKE